MNARRDGMSQPDDPDPEGGHNPSALKDAERKMTNRG
jgi:hypothetical protein